MGNQSRSRIERRKKRDSLRDSVSPAKPKPKPKRRREKKRKDDDDVEFVETIYPKGKQDDDNVGSSPVIAPSLESKSPVVDVNSIDEEKTPDDDDCSVDCDMDVDDGDLRGEEKVSEADEVVSLSSSSEEEGSVEEVCGEDDYSDEEEEDVESDSSDYMEESSDSTYTGSSDSGFDCSDDDDEVGGDARNTAKVKNKSPSERVYKREKPKNYYKKNDLDVFRLLAKSVWDRTKIFDQEICSGEDEDTAEFDTREDPIVRDSSGEYPIVRERKRRRYHREKKKKHLNVTDQQGDSFCEEGGKPWLSTHVNLRFGCEEEPEPIEKTEEEKEIDRLWEDMALALSLEGVRSSAHSRVRILFSGFSFPDDHAFFLSLLRHEIKSFASEWRCVM